MRVDRRVTFLEKSNGLFDFAHGISVVNHRRISTPGALSSESFWALLIRGREISVV